MLCAEGAKGQLEPTNRNVAECLEDADPSPIKHPSLVVNTTTTFVPRPGCRFLVRRLLPVDLLIRLRCDLSRIPVVPGEHLPPPQSV